MTTEDKRILDDMLIRRIESLTKADSEEVQVISELVAKGIMYPERLRNVKTAREIEEDAIRQILASVSDVADDTSMICDVDGPKVDARTIRVWASFYLTPEQKQ